VFLFPFATVFEKFARSGIVVTEMIVFVLILAVGLLYAWKKKVLEWL
jgi:NADH-quinone oxidoreductase subunit A